MAVTVVFPCFNEEHYLLDFCTSMSNQSVRPSLLVMFDNGSTDNSCAVFEKLCIKFNLKFKIIKQKINFLGIRAFRVCFRYISVSDDTCVFLSVHEEYFDNHIAELVFLRQENPNAALVYSLCDFIDEETGQKLTNKPTHFSTTDPDPKKRFYEAVVNTRYSNSFWANYNPEFLRKSCEIRFNRGGDHVAVANMAIYGSILCTNKVTFLRKFNPRRSLDAALIGERPEINPSYSPFAKHPILSFWYEHFLMLDELHISVDNKKELQITLCKACVKKFPSLVHELQSIAANPKLVPHEVQLAGLAASRFMKVRQG